MGFTIPVWPHMGCSALLSSAYDTQPCLLEGLWTCSVLSFSPVWVLEEENLFCVWLHLLPFLDAVKGLALFLAVPSCCVLTDGLLEVTYCLCSQIYKLLLEQTWGS